MRLLSKFLFIIPASFLLLVGPYFSFINFKNTEKNILYIEKGDSITASLNQIISLNYFNKSLLKFYISSNNIKNIKAGEYFVKNKNIYEIINDISNGNFYKRSFTIREGSNIYDLKTNLSKSFLKNDCEMLSCINSYKIKEGLLLPDTYFYYRDTKSSEIILSSNRSLNSLMDKLWINKPDSNPLKNKYEALILASIIEKEAGNNDEKYLISGVILNRLNQKMRLQADPPLIYGLLPNFDGDIKKTDILNKRNIYNTYMNNGLPPSPIAFASKSSIEAAILAEPNEYLFFVADSASSHYFSKSYKEHKEAINRLGLDK